MTDVFSNTIYGQMDRENAQKVEARLMDVMKHTNANFSLRLSDVTVQYLQNLFSELVDRCDKYPTFVHSFGSNSPNGNYNPMLKSFLLLDIVKNESLYAKDVSFLVQELLKDNKIDVTLSKQQLNSPGTMACKNNVVHAYFTGSPNNLWNILKAKEKITTIQTRVVSTQHLWKKVDLSQLHYKLETSASNSFSCRESSVDDWGLNILEHQHLKNLVQQYMLQLLLSSNRVMKQDLFIRNSQDGTLEYKTQRYQVHKMNSIYPHIMLQKHIGRLFTATNDKFEPIMISILLPAYMLEEAYGMDDPLSFQEFTPMLKLGIKTDIAYRLSNGVSVWLKQILNEMKQVQQVAPVLLSFLAFLGDVTLLEEVRNLFQGWKSMIGVQAYGSLGPWVDEFDLSADFFRFEKRLISLDTSIGRRTFSFFASPALSAAVYNQPRVLKYIFRTINATELQIHLFMSDVYDFCNNFGLYELRNTAEQCFGRLQWEV